MSPVTKATNAGTIIYKDEKSMNVYKIKADSIVISTHKGTQTCNNICYEGRNNPIPEDLPSTSIPPPPPLPPSSFTPQTPTIVNLPNDTSSPLHDDLERIRIRTLERRGSNGKTASSPNAFGIVPPYEKEDVGNVQKMSNGIRKLVPIQISQYDDLDNSTNSIAGAGYKEMERENCSLKEKLAERDAIIATLTAQKASPTYEQNAGTVYAGTSGEGQNREEFLTGENLSDGNSGENLLDELQFGDNFDEENGEEMDYKLEYEKVKRQLEERERNDSMLAEIKEQNVQLRRQNIQSKKAAKEQDAKLDTLLEEFRQFRMEAKKAAEDQEKTISQKMRMMMDAKRQRILELWPKVRDIKNIRFWTGTLGWTCNSCDGCKNTSGCDVNKGLKKDLADIQDIVAREVQLAREEDKKKAEEEGEQVEVAEKEVAKGTRRRR